MVTAEPAAWSWPVPEDIDTTDARTALLSWHAGRCGICGAVPGGRDLVEDHDHDTGLTRGMLCRGCNLHEGHCRRADCVCEAWRSMCSTDMLDVEIVFRGTDRSRAAHYRRRGEEPPSDRDAMRRVSAVLAAAIAD